MEQVAEATNVVSQGMRKVAESAETNRKQFLALTSALQARRVLEPANVDSIRSPVLRSPAVDFGRLEAATRPLEIQPLVPRRP